MEGMFRRADILLTAKMVPDSSSQELQNICVIIAFGTIKHLHICYNR